jgi:rfaE bifunctional protein kinase chain/domain
MTPSLSRERLVDLLKGARGKRIAVVGDAMLDVYLIGDVERISPEAPVPVVRIRERRYALGGAANVAQNVTAVGATCDLVAAIGDDRGGATLRAMLDAIGAGSSVVSVGRCTTEKTRIIARSQQLVRVDEEEDSDLAPADFREIAQAITKVVEKADALVVEDYNKGVLTPEIIRLVIDAGIRRNIPIIVDPKYRHFFSFRGATIFKPNRRELEAALGAAVDIDHPSAFPLVLERLGVRHLLLTLGEAGMVLVSERGEAVRVKTAAREVYDVVGAGDTVTAYLAAMMAAGASPLESAIIANIAAGIEVGKLGAATVSPDELLAFAEEHQHVS